MTCTTSQSDSTRVPPVTDEKSPPASRSTGADSPVTALSLTEATPSTTSPSAGNDVVGLDQHQIAARSALASTVCVVVRGVAEQFLGMHVLAHGAQRRRLRLAAPFGDRFGEVREQHREPQPRGNGEHEGRAARIAARAPNAAAMPMIVVRMLPTYTTNMTGLRNCTRGSSFANESRTRRR